MLTALILLTTGGARLQDSLALGFNNPPAWAKPQTWWHWMDGNVTKQGITADLEAMKAVGIGGAEAFTVSQGIPPGPVKYGGPVWREMTAFAVKEAARLGLQMCIHNGAGWSSSGGPWVKPEDAMQVIAWSEKKVDGPTLFADQLPPIKAPRVDSFVPFSRDIAVYAYKTPAGGDVPSPLPSDFLQRTGVERGDGLQVDLSPLKQDVAIPSEGVIPLTHMMDAQGNLTWQVPNGHWTILRIGYVPTGVHNHPAPPEGEGLEVDKLSKEALRHFWAGVLDKVIADVGPKGLKTLNDVLIDSYEVGSQNWSPVFREEFQKRRGYDPVPFLPVIAGRVIDSKEKSERFLWDVRRTIADLYADNYYGGFADIAHEHGMIFSTEPYGNGGFDTIQSGSRADIPMAEFWLGGGAMETTKMVSSLCHVYGHPIVGAESFTGDVMPGRWREEPYMLKALGDRAFCNGINRYIFHRYAMQPWLNLRPGMTMGPWGTHLERTQTWWTEAATWMKYIARCQYLLQSGQFQADACYYYGENAPCDLPYEGGLQPHLPDGYDYDGCDADTLKKMTVRNGRILLPSGMTYRLLILPNSTFMTPQVARKLRELVQAGAALCGSKPTQSPSLTDFPACDDEVRSIADELWGTGKGQAEGNHRFGRGQVFWGEPLTAVLSVLKDKPDFAYSPHNFSTKLIDIHRRIGAADVYFVSNQRNRSTQATCSFRVSGEVPELWHPETGLVEDLPAYSSRDGRTTISMTFDSAESVFVVFRKLANRAHLISFGPLKSRNATPATPRIIIRSARYEADDGRGADVTERVRAMVRDGQYEIPATNAVFGDPAVNIVKHLTIVCTVNGALVKKNAPENESIELTGALGGGEEPKTYSFARRSSDAYELTSWEPATYVAVGDADNVFHRVDVTKPPLEITLSSNWHVKFPPNMGAPPSTDFPKLIDWTASSNPGIKYFSGSALYSKEFVVPRSFVSADRALRLNLGEVKNFATVSLNGKQVAVLWKPPFTLDVTRFVRAGSNRLEVKVTDLWPNRIIGDEQLPPDVEWDGDHLKRWPDWLLEGKPRPKTGRVTFETWHFYDKNSPLLDSGLIGPVTLESAEPVKIRF